jgi:hypothetical protein
VCDDEVTVNKMKNIEEIRKIEETCCKISMKQQVKLFQ